MKLHELFETNVTMDLPDRGMQGAREGGADSRTYNKHQLQAFVADAKAIGCRVMQDNAGNVQAVQPNGKIAGEFSRRYGGMLAYSDTKDFYRDSLE